MTFVFIMFTIFGFKSYKHDQEIRKHRCQIEIVDMNWADGTVSKIKIKVCG